MCVYARSLYKIYFLLQEILKKKIENHCGNRIFSGLVMCQHSTFRQGKNKLKIIGNTDNQIHTRSCAQKRNNVRTEDIAANARNHRIQGGL